MTVQTKMPPSSYRVEHKNVLPGCEKESSNVPTLAKTSEEHFMIHFYHLLILDPVLNPMPTGEKILIEILKERDIEKERERERRDIQGMKTG